MEKGLLSVIIPTYRRSFDMLWQAVNSILTQTYENIEIIVVDDNKSETEEDRAYSDEIREKLVDYPQVKYVKMSRNSGASAARNMGVLCSSGEFISFLDDDDIWLPDKAEKQMALFTSPEIGLVFCTGLAFSRDDIENATPYGIAKNNNLSPSFEDMLTYDYVGSITSIIRREAFALCGIFDTRIQAREDYEMWLRITQNGVKAVGTEEPLFFRRYHVGEQLSKSQKKIIDGLKRIYYLYRKDYRKKANRKAEFTILTMMSYSYSREGKLLPRMWYLICAFFRSPIVFIRETVFRFKNK